MRELLDQLSFFDTEIDWFIDERDIRSGQLFDEVIAEAVERATFAVLLVSPGFHGSGYIRDHELPALLGKGISLAWALVRPCPWQQVQAVQDRNALHDVKLGALEELQGPSRARCWTEIAEKIASDAVAALAELGPAVGGSLGRLDGVPPLPARYVPRLAELVRLREALTEGVASVTGVRGVGGVGKSVLAAALVTGDEIRREVCLT
jgi:hypothetical protein